MKREEWKAKYSEFRRKTNHEADETFRHWDPEWALFDAIYIPQRFRDDFADLLRWRFLGHTMDAYEEPPSLIPKLFDVRPAE